MVIKEGIIVNEVSMITAYRKKVKVKPGGQIDFRSPDFEPGTIAEVIVLIEKNPVKTDRSIQSRKLVALFKDTQSLPQAQSVTDEEILAEIAAYRAGKM
jgi:hypothetical protein